MHFTCRRSYEALAILNSTNTDRCKCRVAFPVDLRKKNTRFNTDFKKINTIFSTRYRRKNLIKRLQLDSPEKIV